MTTAADFRANLAALVVPGVARRYQGKPLDIEAGDCPAQWVGTVSTEAEPITYTVRQSIFTADLYIAVTATVGGDTESNEAQSAIDALQADIATEMNSVGISGFDVREYTLEQSVIDVNGTNYDGLIVSITAR